MRKGVFYTLAFVLACALAPAHVVAEEAKPSDAASVSQSKQAIAKVEEYIGIFESKFAQDGFKADAKGTPSARLEALINFIKNSDCRGLEKKQPAEQCDSIKTWSPKAIENCPAAKLLGPHCKTLDKANARADKSEAQLDTVKQLIENTSQQLGDENPKTIAATATTEQKEETSNNNTSPHIFQAAPAAVEPPKTEAKTRGAGVTQKPSDMQMAFEAHISVNCKEKAFGISNSFTSTCTVDSSAQKPWTCTGEGFTCQGKDVARGIDWSCTPACANGAGDTKKQQALSAVPQTQTNGTAKPAALPQAQAKTDCPTGVNGAGWNNAGIGRARESCPGGQICDKTVRIDGAIDTRYICACDSRCKK